MMLLRRKYKELRVEREIQIDVQEDSEEEKATQKKNPGELQRLSSQCSAAHRCKCIGQCLDSRK